VVLGLPLLLPLPLSLAEAEAEADPELDSDAEGEVGALGSLGSQLGQGDMLALALPLELGVLLSDTVGVTEEEAL
jgi:hypothetical protein